MICLIRVSPIFLLLLPPMLAFAAIEDGVTIQKTATANSPDYIELFVGYQFYPGQTITVSVSGGPIDVNHKYWEDRECNWLGLHCWYEQRDAPNPYTTAVFPVLLRVKGANGNITPLRPTQAVDNRFSLSGEPSIPFPTGDPASPESLVVNLDIDGSSKDLGAFGTPLEFIGKIADRGGNGVQINRSPCVSRNACSGGGFVVAVTDVNNDGRFQKLTALLGSGAPPAPSAVISVLQADRLLSRDPAMKQKLADLLFNHVSTRYKADKTSAEYIGALEYAASLDASQGAGKIGNALSEAYLASGNFVSAKQTAGKGYDILEPQFESDRSNKEVRKSLIVNIELTGAVLVGERGALYSSDLVKAVSMYRRASDLAYEVAKDSSQTSDIRREFYALAYGALVEASRALMMARTEQNLLQAEKITELALKLATESIALPKSP